MSQTELYRYFDADDRPLYIGVSQSALERARGAQRQELVR